jgi:hypothetical protein
VFELLELEVDFLDDLDLDELLLAHAGTATSHAEDELDVGVLIAVESGRVRRVEAVFEFHDCHPGDAFDALDDLGGLGR